jgi:DNA-binding PadR family transcriptional regulator
MSRARRAPAGRSSTEEPRLTPCDLVVLSLLGEAPRHGYDLWMELERREVRDWAGISRPQVYYSLRKLEAAGLIAATGDDAPAAGPERRVFSVTRRAPAALARALEPTDWATQRPPPPFITWLVLSGHARPAIVRRLIERRRRFLDDEIAKERRTLVAIRAENGPELAAAVVELGIRLFEAEREWLANLPAGLGMRG